MKPNYFVAVILALAASPAYAYIDPGSGSAIMSAIVGFPALAAAAIPADVAASTNGTIGSPEGA